ncbi:D-alanyl-D-alanine carboxypeptidase family protein [Streptomyces sp. NPDC048248]|uniref:D-alanyl-D-alanine carboxypeptidase family protein n=1 Tax=Streptomyces sp. NPDC048248 TaxID=3365523 RepID=UPI0037128D77
MVVCAASLLVTCGPAVADGPHGIDDARSVGSGPAIGSRLHQPGVQFLPRPGVPGPPDVTALSWAVTDARSGRILAAKDAHRRLPPASTLKTLFALTVLPKFPQRAAHTVTDADLAGILPGSALVGIKEDARYSVADLWRGVFLSSGSDAVRTLAAMNGGWDKTVADMGAMARRLGANDTTVRSADGFDSEGQFSSAFDLAVFGRAGLANPDFARLASTKTAKFPESGGERAFGIQNTNRLLVGSHGVVPYPGLIGVKNGYTTQAGNTLVAAAERNGRTLLVTVMNPQTGSENAVYEETRTLLDWGFAAAPRAAGVGTLPETVPIEPPREADDAVGKSQHAVLSKKAEHADAAPGMALAGERDAQRRTLYVWSLAAAGASVLAGVALWWRRRKQHNAPPAPPI